MICNVFWFVIGMTVGVGLMCCLYMSRDDNGKR